jgi:hypothetical protein
MLLASSPETVRWQPRGAAVFSPFSSHHFHNFLPTSFPPFHRYMYPSTTIGSAHLYSTSANSSPMLPDDLALTYTEAEALIASNYSYRPPGY